MPSITKSDLIDTNIAISVNKSALSVQKKCPFSPKKCLFQPKKVPFQSKKCPFFSPLLSALLKTALPPCPSDLPAPLGIYPKHPFRFFIFLLSPFFLFFLLLLSSFSFLSRVKKGFFHKSALLVNKCALSVQKSAL